MNSLCRQSIKIIHSEGHGKGIEIFTFREIGL